MAAQDCDCGGVLRWRAAGAQVVEEGVERALEAQREGGQQLAQVDEQAVVVEALAATPRAHESLGWAFGGSGVGSVRGSGIGSVRGSGIGSV
eukprot:225641-Prymnesium_polylepis.1